MSGGEPGAAAGTLVTTPADADEAFRAAMVHTHRLGVKDLGQALALAERNAVAMPAAEAALAEFAAVVRLPDEAG